MNKLFKTISVIIFLLQFSTANSQTNTTLSESIDYFCQDCDRELFIGRKFKQRITDSKNITYEVSISSKGTNKFSCTILNLNTDNKLNFDVEGQWMIDIGKAILNNSSTNILIRTGIGGSGGAGCIINLINFESLKFINLYFIQLGQELPTIDRSDNFYDLREESAFVEKLKYEYGFFDEESLKNNSNPDKMFEVWKYNNNEIQNGKITINIYKGTPEYAAGITTTLETDDLFLTAYFKSGVIAKNKKDNSYFVIFVPKFSYCWIQTMEKYKEYIILGTGGEGLAIINLNSLELKRIDLGEDYNDVKKISVVNDRITINDNKKIKFKDF